MPRLQHSPSIDGAFTHNGERYRIEDGIIEVDDIDVAREMAQHPRVELLEMDATPGVDAGNPPFYCGEEKANGEPCKREVDAADSHCWQHS